MTFRALTFLIAVGCATLPTLAQQLRATPQLGGVRPASEAGIQRPADHIVAVVNSEPITNNEVRARLLRIEQQMTQAGSALPPREQLARRVLEQLIVERAQLQHARQIGVRADEVLVDQAEQNIARQNRIDVAELRRRLVADGIAPERFRAELRDQILLQRLREREVDARVTVTEADIDQFIRERRDNPDGDDVELNLAQILIAVPENASDEQLRALEARARDVLARARAGADFAQLARERSDAPGAARSGGLMGLRPADRYPELFVQAVRGLREGQISDLIRSGAGFHVLKVIEKRQAGLPGVTVVQSRTRHILLRPDAQLPESVVVERLNDFRRRVESGQARFDQLAREHSQDGSARNGGDLGWTSPGTFVPEFEDAVTDLQPGQVSPPVRSRFGWHLILLEERREARLTEREQRDIARNLVRERKADEAYASWARELRGRAWVELREAVRP